MTASSAESRRLRSSAPYLMIRAMTVAAVALGLFSRRPDGHSHHAVRDGQCSIRRDVRIVGAVTDRESGDRVPEIIDPTVLEEGISERLGRPWIVSVFVREGSDDTAGNYQVHVTDEAGVTFESAWSFLTMGIKPDQKVIDIVSRRIKTVLGEL